MNIEVLENNPELRPKLNKLHKQFPAFISSGGYVGDYYWNKVGLVEHFPAYQFALTGENGEVIGCGHTIPLYWNGSLEDLPGGYDEAIKRGFENKLNGIKPNILCALAAVTDLAVKEKKLSYVLLEEMKKIARTKGYGKLIAPVAPLWKPMYPLTPISHYAKWKNDKEEPFDPWLRVHVKMGGKVIAMADKSMHIKGTLSDWEGWTGMIFPESGQYVIPHASQPLTVYYEKDYAEYYDQNIWVVHQI